MLRITIDLVPFGEESESNAIGEMIIGNIAMLPDNMADYVYGYQDNFGVEKVGLVNNFDRSAGVWELVSSCLNAEPKEVPGNI
jgi:hypothetical protein